MHVQKNQSCRSYQEVRDRLTGSGSILPQRKPNLKLPQIEEKIGVNIEFNINPDFLFDLREL